MRDSVHTTLPLDIATLTSNIHSIDNRFGSKSSFQHSFSPIRFYAFFDLISSLYKLRDYQTPSLFSFFLFSFLFSQFSDLAPSRDPGEDRLLSNVGF